MALPLGLAVAPPADADPDWNPVIHCESRGNPTAQNRSSTASGLFQFLDSTWRGLGGTGRAKDASVAEQYRIANRQYALSGFTAWNASRSCWSRGGGGPRVAPVPAPRAAPRPAPVTSPGRTVTVRVGQSLSSIARDNGTSWQALWQANRGTIHNPHRIFPGQVVRLP
jgi:hypothetical protein